MFYSAFKENNSWIPGKQIRDLGIGRTMLPVCYQLSCRAIQDIFTAVHTLSSTSWTVLPTGNQKVFLFTVSCDCILFHQQLSYVYVCLSMYIRWQTQIQSDITEHGCVFWPVGWWWSQPRRCQRRSGTGRRTGVHLTFLEACLQSDSPLLPSPHPLGTAWSYLNMSKILKM